MTQWKPLAESGDCKAQYWLGTLYFHGLGVQRNYMIAKSWWKKAASQGHVRSQVDLGAMLFHGKQPSEFCPTGCDAETNLVEDYKWHAIANRVAAGQLRVFTDGSLKIIRDKMSRDKVLEAENLVSQWTIKPIKCH